MTSPSEDEGETLEQTILSLKNSMAEAAHRLSHVLAVFRLCAETWDNELTTERRKERQHNLLAECDEAERIIRKMGLHSLLVRSEDHHIYPRAISLCSCLLSVMQRYRRFASRNEQSIVLDLPLPADQLLIDGDERYLSEVFMNLLDNAVKYSPAGTPITVAAFRDSSNFCIVRVHNVGPHIASEELVQVFQPGYRSQLAQQISPRGMGVGLWISQRIVEQHGGRVWCESERNEHQGFLADVHFYVKMPAHV